MSIEGLGVLSARVSGQEDLLAEFPGQVLLTAPVGRRRDDGGGVAGHVIAIGGVARL
jgi:hypothetical protein